LDLTRVSTDEKLWRLRLDCLDASLAFDEEAVVVTDALLDGTPDEDDGVAARPRRREWF
jgi:hypothetical protein